MKELKCKKCGKPIYFIKTVGGSQMPVNTKMVTICTKKGEVKIGYTVHWANCTSPDYFRKKK